MRALAFSGGKDSMACLHLLRGSLDCAIYVDTGFSFPETRAMVDYAASLIPMHMVSSPRAEQNAQSGLPAEIVPIDWTVEGQACTGKKLVTIQPYIQCCLQNIGAPLYIRAKELGVTELFYGQRHSDGHKAPVTDGGQMGSITRRHPIEDWTSEQVLAFLQSKMDVPTHYGLQHSSLDCYDCTAYKRESVDRIIWMKAAHPNLYGEYLARATRLAQALDMASAGLQPPQQRREAEEACIH